MPIQFSPITKGKTMSAIITETSLTVETQLVVNGITIETRYHDNLAQADEYLQDFDIVDVEYETLTI